MAVFLGGENARVAQTVHALLAGASPVQTAELHDALAHLANSIAGRELRDEEYAAVLRGGDSAFEALLRRYLHEGLRQFGRP